MLVLQKVVTESKKRNKKNVLFSYLKVKEDLLGKLSKSMASKLIAYCCYFSVNTNKLSLVVLQLVSFISKSTFYHFI